MNGPSSPAPKSGASPWTVVGIGCGVVLVVSIILMFVLVRTCTKAVTEFADEVQKNPAKAIATQVVKMNPELELVSTDDSKGEITVKNTKTGEVLTLSFEDIAEGKFSMKNSKGEEINIDASDVKETGTMKIKGPDGEMVLGGAMITPPQWVPVYPGASATPGGMRSVKESKLTGMAAAETTDTVAQVKEFYESQLKAKGYATEVSMATTGATETAIVNGKLEAEGRMVNVMATAREGKTSLVISYEGPGE